MRRTFLLVVGFLLSAGVLLAALGWVSRLALDLAASEAEARRHATFEERVRLSLWHMDSALAVFLAEENARPADARDAGQAAPRPGEAERPYLAARFEIDAAGRVRESPATPRARPRPGPPLKRDTLLASLGGGPLAGEEPASPGSKPGPPRALQAQGAASSSVVTPPPRVSASDAKETFPSKVQPTTSAQARGDPVAREMANQTQLNRVEFEQRGANESGPASPDASGPAPSAAEGRAAPGAPRAASPVTPPPAPATLPGAPRRPPRWPPPRPHPAGPARAARARVLSALSPVWIGDDLVLARRVARGGGEHLQGLRLDGTGVRAWLAAQVRDLLPSAALLALRPGETADPGRRLALLPLRLDPGPLPPPQEAAGSVPIRLGLAVASTALLLAIAAAGLLLALSLRLARRRADFVSAVTHELRTPLTTFRLYTEMLDGGMVPDAERPGYLGTLRDEAGRLGHLVENVLAFARLERGRRRLVLEDLELATLVGEAAARLAPRAERDGLALEVDLPADTPPVRVRADRLSVERILENLVDNACKYGRGAADSRLHLDVRLRDRRAVVTVRDHGPGVAVSHRRLFRPFHRSAADAAGAPPGIGLGLALSRRLARGFGGDLRLAIPHPADGGAAFELLLPLAS